MASTNGNTWQCAFPKCGGSPNRRKQFTRICIGSIKQKCHQIHPKINNVHIVTKYLKIQELLENVHLRQTNKQRCTKKPNVDDKATCAQLLWYAKERENRQKCTKTEATEERETGKHKTCKSQLGGIMNKDEFGQMATIRRIQPTYTHIMTKMEIKLNDTA